MFALSLYKHKKSVKSAPSSDYRPGFSMVLIRVMTPQKIRGWAVALAIRHTGLIARASGIKETMASGRWQQDKVEKHTERSAGGGPTCVRECADWDSMHTELCFFGVQLVASCATVICADVTGCWPKDIRENPVRKSPVFLCVYCVCQQLQYTTLI